MDTGFNREPEGTLNSMTRDGKAYYYLTDALGSVVATADESGTKVNSYSYSPRGVTRSSSSEETTQPYRFAGGYQDPTGMYHYAARYYDPNIGRFTQPDPSGQEKNPYLYADGDPVNRIDPSGLFSFSDALDIGSKVLGAVTGCIAGATAASQSGISLAASAVGGPVGAGAALGGGCVVGAGAALAGGQILTY